MPSVTGSAVMKSKHEDVRMEAKETASRDPRGDDLEAESTGVPLP